MSIFTFGFRINEKSRNILGIQIEIRTQRRETCPNRGLIRQDGRERSTRACFRYSPDSEAIELTDEQIEAIKEGRRLAIHVL